MERATSGSFVHGFPVKRFSGRTQRGRVEPSDAEQITGSSLAALPPHPNLHLDSIFMHISLVHTFQNVLFIVRKMHNV